MWADNNNNIKKIKIKAKNNERGWGKRHFTQINYKFYRKDISAINFYALNNIAAIHKAETKR